MEISVMSFLGVILSIWECQHFISIAKSAIHWGSRLKMCGADTALSWVNFRFNQFLSLYPNLPWGCQVVIVFHLATLSYQGQIQKREKVGFIQGQGFCVRWTWKRMLWPEEQLVCFIWKPSPGSSYKPNLWGVFLLVECQWFSKMRFSYLWHKNLL